MMRPIVSSSLKYRLLVVTIAAVTMVFGFRQLRNAPVEVLPDRWTVVTRDRSRSAHFEHTVAVTEDGHRILSIP